VREVLADATLQDRQARADDASVHLERTPDGRHGAVPGVVCRNGSGIDRLDA
jgi:hypothetical protein